MQLFRKTGHDVLGKLPWTSSLLQRGPRRMPHFSYMHHSFFCYHFPGNLNQGEYTFLSASHHCELVSLVGNVALILLSELIKFNILIFLLTVQRTRALSYSSIQEARGTLWKWDSSCLASPSAFACCTLSTPARAALFAGTERGRNIRGLVEFIFNAWFKSLML